MLLRFWGTRGSLPVAPQAADLRRKLAKALLAASGKNFATLEEAEAFALSLPFAQAHTYGGNSSCVELELPGQDGSEFFLCDLGSGARAFGNSVLAKYGAGPKTFHIFMSHLHWDHIMGFPFFAPAYIRGNQIRIYGCHAELERAFRRQQEAPSFPVDFSVLAANIEFVTLQAGQSYELAGLRVLAKKQLHAGDSYGYRFEHAGKAVIYSTDSEHKLDAPEETQSFVEFFRGADAVVFDAMYSLADAVSVKADWGHSSNMMGVELCQLAGAKRLLLFHHEPIYCDERIAEVEAETRRLERITRGDGPALEVLAAYDGLELTV